MSTTPANPGLGGGLNHPTSPPPANEDASRCHQTIPQQQSPSPQLQQQQQQQQQQQRPHAPQYQQQMQQQHPQHTATKIRLSGEFASRFIRTLGRDRDLEND